MKRVLLGTTALVAAGAFAGVGAAQADEMMAEPISVGVGGYTTGAIGFYSNDSDEMRGHDVSYVYEISISGSTTLDNGITVAVSGQIGRSGKPNSAIDNFDEIHTTLSGAFGSLRLGRTESAAFNATVAAPGAAIGGMIGVNYDWFAGAAKSVNTYSGLGDAEDALKVVYTTPNFNGLTIGMSYAPEDNEANFAGRKISDGLGAHTAVGMTYSTDFMEGGSLTFGAGYETAEREGKGDNPEGMRFGINVSVDQLSFGGSMFDDDNTLTNGAEYDIGASWTEGPVEIGIQYAANEKAEILSKRDAKMYRLDAADGQVKKLKNPVTSRDAKYGETSKTALHLTYTLGPGVLVGGQIAAGTIEGMDDVTQFMIGTAVFF